MKFIALSFIALCLPFSAFAAGTLSCSGQHVWHGEGISDKFTLTAVIENPGKLLFIQDNREEEGDVTEFYYDERKADPNYKPYGKRYEGFNRFALKGGSGWTRYYLLLPKDLGSQPTAKGFIQRTGHDSYPTIRLRCEITGMGL